MELAYTGRTQVRVPDHARIRSAAAPTIMGIKPALNVPVENANVILNKQIATLNRAGSNSGNPILAGLGVRAQIGIGTNDRLIGVYLFQDPGVRGANLMPSVSVAGQYATLDFLAGSGQTVAGTAATGAKRNFFRWVTEAGANERQFWIKGYDADIVKANDQACLAEDTLLPVQIALEIVDAGRDWITVPVDFMPSWADEFQALGDPSGQQGAAGFKKSYGGALFVSFFDKATATEGVGVQVNPITQASIFTRRSIEVQNTAGLKQLTVRFRSEQDSPYFVDVDIEFMVTAPDVESCDVPFSEACSSVYLKAGTACPANCPDVASVPGEQVVAGTPGSPLAADLLVVTVHGTLVGAAPKLRVWKYKWSANAKALAGADLVRIAAPEDYLPLVLDADGPVEAPPYGDPHRLVIAFTVTQLRTDLVAAMNVSVVDGDHISEAIPIAGPRARDIGILPIGGTGGTGDDICAY